MGQLENNISRALFGLHHATAANGIFPAWPLAEWVGEETDVIKNAFQWAVELASQGHQKLFDQQHRVSIFANIQRRSADPPLTNRFIPMSSLHLDEEVIFPKSALEVTTADSDLSSIFTRELARFNNINDPATYLAALYDLLRRTAWCLPAPYGLGDEPDVSLFDYARVIAALLPCYREPNSAVTFINGDLSGVQEFLYTITSLGAVSGLRGRSFYLQLLTDACARYLLRILDLPQTSMIYNSGGHFLLLAPSGVDNKIKEAQKTISNLLLTYHRGDLYLALGSHEFQTADFHPTQFSDAWTQLSQATQRAKRQRFSELGETMFTDVFTPQGSGGDEKTDCAVCHYDGKDMKPEEREGESIYKCSLCVSLEELGRDLRQATHLLLVHAEPKTSKARTWQNILGAFGFKAAAFNQNSDRLRIEKEEGDERGELVCLNETAESDWWLRERIESQKEIPIALSGRFVVNVTPLVTQEDREKILDDFEVGVTAKKVSPDEKEKQRNELAKVGDVREFSLIEEAADGIKRLGVLRMDVDGLGDIFARGFGEGQSSLTRTAALSFAMSLYFEGWVETLAKEANNGRNVVYSIYSGGDDLFIVAAWDVLPELAYKINRDLGRYAAGNPAIHASAGITLHTGKYPLYQAAENAHDALEAAKDYEDEDGRKKDAFTFLDQTRPWRDFEEIREEQRSLYHLVEEQGIPRSSIQ
ncbi:MAG: type III-A CRISPR-associated protein Cas10/Csm1, partial [Candidatus Promineifilaceae bacterium]